MDTNSSGEELFIKTRKPYTITKQRERWTVEEHNRFLEALKLYGRAWQRIEEHIGTKTAVQIRSHAQKFFTKLEKEAVAKGVPIGQALDIDIPPPRPKRKPSNPYPRKTGVSSMTSKDGKVSVSLPVPRNQQVLDLETEPPPEKSSVDEKSTGAKGIHDDSCSQVFTSSSSVYSLKKYPTPQQQGPTSPGSFREFVPRLKDVLDNSYHLHDNIQQGKKADDHTNILPGDKMQSMQNFPEHIPVKILDRKTCTQNSPPDVLRHKSMVPGGESQAQSTVYSLLTTSAAEIQNNFPASSHQSFPPLVRSQDEYKSFLQMSSTFSSLVVSTLLQNPAAHAAASFAASFWPFANVGNAADSTACTKEGFSSREINSAPSMAAIATATVAAATAWWAAHGLLPMCAPLQTAFPCPPATTVPRDARMASKEVNLEDPPLNHEWTEPEHLEAAQVQNSSSKLSDKYSPECEENGGLKPNSTPKVTDQETNATPPEVHDCNKSKNRKQVDRSSCGSNTASSSEVETDALEKNEKDEEKTKEAETNPLAPADSRRSRSNNGSTSDSWKSVSEEGRLAFRALFSREVLPQSFSPPPKGEGENGHHEEDNDEVQMPYVDRRNGDSEVLDLNSSKTWCQEGAEKNPYLPSCFSAVGVGNGKLKGRRTGFKPYKRCSVEAKENRSCSCQGEEKESKRICLGLEPEAST